MIFALYDYLCYRARSGRYSRNYSANHMAAAWDCPLPEQTLSLLTTGDILLYQSFNSISSWLIMYGTSSHVSHIGVYVSKGKIFHSTPPLGAILEDIKNTYSPATRILPLHMPSQIAVSVDIIAEQDELERLKMPYGYSAVISKALNIATARLAPFFRWRFFGDVFTAFLVADCLLFALTGIYGLTSLSLAYLLLVLTNLIRWKLKPLNLGENGPPCFGFLVMKANGGVPIIDPKHIPVIVNRL